MSDRARDEAIQGLRDAGCQLDLSNASVGGFGDSAELSANLISLVLSGTKTATASAVRAWEIEAAPLPAAGELEIVLDWAGKPACVIETVEVVVRPFIDLPADFAAEEGEGDRSLEWWRAAHEAYFRREGSRLGYGFTDDMPVVCQRFKVAWKPG
ncbi:MAG: ASCH domain-containing protein [Dehalococcoidia bacterium]